MKKIAYVSAVFLVATLLSGMPIKSANAESQNLPTTDKIAAAEGFNADTIMARQDAAQKLVEDKNDVTKAAQVITASSFTSDGFKLDIEENAFYQGTAGIQKEKGVYSSGGAFSGERYRCFVNLTTGLVTIFYDDTRTGHDTHTVSTYKPGDADWVSIRGIILDTLRDGQGHVSQHEARNYNIISGDIQSALFPNVRRPRSENPEIQVRKPTQQSFEYASRIVKGKRYRS